MLFWIFVLVLVLGIGLVHIYNNKNVGEGCAIAGVVLSVLCALAIFISLICMSCDYFAVEGTIAKEQQRYESLMYQYENDIYNNDNDLGKKELMSEIQEWNEDIAAKQANQDNFWIGIYIPDIYDQFELIELHNGE